MPGQQNDSTDSEADTEATVKRLFDEADQSTVQRLHDEAAAQDEKHGDSYPEAEMADSSDTEESADTVGEGGSHGSFCQPPHGGLPTLCLPFNHPFRTSPAGYPVRQHHPRSSGPVVKLFGCVVGSPASVFRALDIDEQHFGMDPYTVAFVRDYTHFYDQMSNAQLRDWCRKRGVVTYGRKKQLVERLVDRVLRDAARGWSESWGDTLGVRYEDAPQLLGTFPLGQDEELW